MIKVDSELNGVKRSESLKSSDCVCVGGSQLLQGEIDKLFKG